MSQYVLGVDGGGTATVALIADFDGTVVGRGISIGCACYQIGGIEQCRELLRLSITRALEEARIAPEQIVQATFGLTGAD